MAGIGLIMELLRKNLKVNGHTLHSTGLYSATYAATTSAVYIAAGTPFASQSLFGLDGRKVAYCDAITTSDTIFQHDFKEYDIELKPLFSAFQLRPFALTSLRCFSLFYLPLLQSNLEDCANVSLNDLVDEHQDVDYVGPLKMTVKQILLETSVVTTRRVLERLAVRHFSQRVAWKLIKDVPMSAVRKANRRMPFYTYFFCVSRTQFRGQFLGHAASWLVQIGVECYRFVRDISKSKKVEDVDVRVDHEERVKVLGKKVYYVTVRCCSQLVYASIAAGIGATLLRPSSGQAVSNTNNHTTRHTWLMWLVRLYSPRN